MIFLFVLLAACCGGAVNFFMRKNLDKGGTSVGYLVVQFTLSLVVALTVNPVFKSGVEWNSSMFFLGISIGILMMLMMFLTTCSLNRGPASLTFAFQNSGSVFPTLILGVIFGTLYGFEISKSLVIGGACVLIGLFWAAMKQTQAKTSLSWYFFATGMFLLQAFILTAYQWKCLLTVPNEPHFLIPFSCRPEDEVWFMPGLFIAATALQTAFFLIKYKRSLNKSELMWGTFGGIGNGLATYLLLQANIMSSSLEKGIIFPLFAVAVILICNLWGRLIYKENVCWSANALCSVGILIAAIW